MLLFGNGYTDRRLTDILKSDKQVQIKQRFQKAQIDALFFTGNYFILNKINNFGNVLRRSVVNKVLEVLIVQIIVSKGWIQAVAPDASLFTQDSIKHSTRLGDSRQLLERLLDFRIVVQMDHDTVAGHKVE